MTAKKFLKAVLPSSARRWLRRQPLKVDRLLGGDVELLRRTTPIGDEWGGSRGQIIDRYYIEKFLARHTDDICGHVLEFGDDAYTRRFGGDKVGQVDVLNLTRDIPGTTIVADLAEGAPIPSDTFDCIICTQVLLVIYDLPAAIRTLHRILKPGGVVLVTVPGIQKISRGDMDTCGDYWRFTTLSLGRLFAGCFPKDQIEVKASGNVLAAVAFLHGLAVEDLQAEDLDRHDPDFEVSIGLRAVKPASIKVSNG
jgi:SAM-dependent methyltransferase